MAVAYSFHIMLLLIGFMELKNWLPVSQNLEFYFLISWDGTHPPPFLSLPVIFCITSNGRPAVKLAKGAESRTVTEG